MEDLQRQQEEHMVEEENYQIFSEHLIIGEAEAEEQDILQQEEMVV